MGYQCPGRTNILSLCPPGSHREWMIWTQTPASGIHILPKNPTAREPKQTRPLCSWSCDLTRQPNLTQRKWSQAESQGKEGQRCCPRPSPADLGTSWGRVSSWICLWSVRHVALMKSTLNKCSLGYWNTRFILSSSVAVSGRTLPLSLCINQFSQCLVKFMGSRFPSSLISGTHSF